MLLGVPLLLLAAPAAEAAVSIGDAQVTETNSAATATFTVTRTGGLLTGPATIHFDTADGSARAPQDYDAISGDLHFGSLALGGTQVQTVPVAIRGDRLDEATETFRLVLSGSSEVAAGADTGVGTIVDDDPQPVVDVADADASAEGGTAIFTISLSAPSGRDVSVAFTTVDGSAVAGEDYTARSGTLGIPAGDTSATLGVPLLDDGADEPDESLGLRIGSPVLATLGRATAGATIVDNDEPPAPPPPAPDAGAAVPPQPPADAATSSGASASAAPLALAPDGAAEPAGAAAPQFGLSSPRLRRPSIILVTVSCPRQSTGCGGRVTIFSRAAPRSRIKALRRERRLGQRNFKLAPGVTRTLTIALSKADRMLLLRTGRMLVRAYAVTTDDNASSVRRSTGTLIARTTHS